MASSSIVFYLNGEQVEVAPEYAHVSLASWLRRQRNLPGTKIVCSEGDCGACSILMASAFRPQFISVNSCILFMYQLDGRSVVTVEGMASKKGLHPVQKAMVECHGSQCGYCTPGFISSLGGLVEDCLVKNKSISESRTKNFLSGNLCRCTGYKAIIESSCSVDLDKCTPLSDRYLTNKIRDVLKTRESESLHLKSKKFEVFAPTTLKKALELKEKYPDARVVSGASDMGVLVNKERVSVEKVLYLGKVQELYHYQAVGQEVRIGAGLTFSELEVFIQNDFPEFEKLIHVFASPQIKNTATLAGNVVNGSPIGDSLPFLFSANAKLVLKSVEGERVVPIRQFFKGYKDLDIKKNELLISINVSKNNREFKLFKVAQRKDLDISIVTMGASYSFKNNLIKKFDLALGGVGPTVLMMPQVSELLEGCEWNRKNFEKAAALLPKLIKPLSDVRGSKEYRLKLCQNLLLKVCDSLEVTHERR